MDQYVLSINVEGVDYQIQVEDWDTANLLLNDYNAAVNYVKQLKAANAENAELSDTEASCSSSVSKASKESDVSTIWTRKKPTDKDLEATSLLLALREQHQLQFDDKKSNKMKLWSMIAQELEKHNFYLGENSAERCRQKFANLTKAYLAYIKHQKTTGEGKKEEDAPPFFDEMHSLLGSKHKVQPKQLEDSYEQEKEEEPCGEDYINNRFVNVRSKIKPSSRRDLILRELKEERLERQREFTFLQGHLKKSEEQKDRFLNILEKAFKRKRESDSE